MLLSGLWPCANLGVGHAGDQQVVDVGAQPVSQRRPVHDKYLRLREQETLDMHAALPVQGTDEAHFRPQGREARDRRAGQRSGEAG